MYLMDGTSRIMISAALNASDRLSSCSKNARKHLDGVDSLFNVYSFQTLDYADAGQLPEEFMMRYNMGGINIDQAAFEKLNQENLAATHRPATANRLGQRTGQVVQRAGPGGGGFVPPDRAARREDPADRSARFLFQEVD